MILFLKKKTLFLKVGLAVSLLFQLYATYLTADKDIFL